jgi:hypothetical protein
MDENPVRQNVMFGATTLSTAHVIDNICKGVTRPPSAGISNRFGREFSVSFFDLHQYARRQYATVNLSVRASAFSVLGAGRLIQGRFCFGRAGPFHVRHICNTSLESKHKRKKSNENSSFRHAFELTEASTRNTS